MAHGDWREAAAKKGVMKGCFPARVGPAFAVAEYRAVQAEFTTRAVTQSWHAIIRTDKYGPIGQDRSHTLDGLFYYYGVYSV